VAEESFAFRIADLAEVGLLRVDHYRVIRQANAAGERIMAPIGRSFIGRTVLEVFLDHRVTDTLDEMLISGTAQCEVSFGSEPRRTLLLNALRIPTGAWLVIRDVSELRRLRRIRTEFVDNLAHELRTPLTNIRLLAETLSMQADDAALSGPVRESIQRIDAETDHLATMVSELLDLARIEHGDVPMRREPVDLGEVVTSAINRLRPLAERNSVRIVEQAPSAADERTVTGDAERLEQLVVNLVHNAIKFSPPEGEVTVSVWRTADQPASVVTEVRDVGPGIPRQALERVFERFYKVDRARTHGDTSGTGLGLSIARHIVDAHGGRIWVESLEGEGASFFVELPAA
jgi:two-component system phosphate regulon sensor histidine kinase PhoR